MSRVRSLLVLVLVLSFGAALLSVAEAQDGRGRRRGRAMGGSFLGLLSSDKVQAELKLNDDETEKLKAIGQELWQGVSEQFAGLREIEDRSERRAKMTELTDQLDEKAREKISEVLSGEQMIRLYQIRLQVRGDVYGLNHTWVAGRLALTDEQRAKAAELKKATQEKLSGVFSGLRDLSQDERRAKMTEAFAKYGKIREEADAKALGLLTAEQKKTFEGFQGEKFEL